jgi:hypothetical protein
MNYRLAVVSVFIFANCLALEKPVVQMMSNYDLEAEQKKDDFLYIPQAHSLINKKARDRYFQLTGISSFIQTYDEVEKNVLYFRLRKFELKRLVKIYPTIPEKNLKIALKFLENRR